MNSITAKQVLYPAQSSKVLIFAWLVEAVAVVMGLVLAVFAGIEGSDGGLITISIAILPFAALSIVELTRIPLVGLAFQVQSVVWRLIAVCALLLVTAATFENFVFGFERSFNERIRAVEAAEQEVRSRESTLELAKTHLPQLTARQTEIAARLATLRDEATAIRQQAQQDISDVRTSNTAGSLATERAQAEKDLAALDVRREAAITVERNRCRANPQSVCRISAVATSFQRERETLTRRIERRSEEQRAQEASAGADVSNARQRRDAQLAGINHERQALEAELDGVRNKISDANAVGLRGSEEASAAKRNLEQVIERSQLHRLANVLFGNHNHETVEQTKKLFVVSLAAIIALVGSLIAALHYAAQRQHAQRGLIGRALRAYVARHRRAIPVRRRIVYTPKEKTGLVRNLRGWAARRRRSKLPVQLREVVKEVPVDRLKIVFLPLDASEEQVAKARDDAHREFDRSKAEVSRKEAA